MVDPEKSGAFTHNIWSCDELIAHEAPVFHIEPYIRGGLHRLYHMIKTDTVPELKDYGYHTNSEGQFDPKAGCLMGLRYKVKEKVESGGLSSVVVLVEDLFCGNRTLVVKVLNSQFYQLGLQESHTLLKLARTDPLNHSHTLRLLTTLTFDSHYCLVFQPLLPHPLTSVFAEIPHHKVLHEIRKVGLRLLGSVGFLHQQNLIHTDLKPDNILLKHEGDLDSVHIVDFGSAINHVHSEVSLYYKDFELQTPLYRAPEVMFGVPFGQEIDIWSLGCILAELYLGKQLFYADSKQKIMEKISNLLGPFPAKVFRKGKFFKTYKALTEDNPQQNVTLKLMDHLQCSDVTFADLIAGMLAYNPDERLTASEAARHPFFAPYLPLAFLLPSSHGSSSSYSPVCVSKAVYTYTPDIAPDIKKRQPSSLDLLRMGTSELPPCGSGDILKPSPRHGKILSAGGKYQHDNSTQLPKRNIGFKSPGNGGMVTTKVQSDMSVIRNVVSERKNGNVSESVKDKMSKLLEAIRKEQTCVEEDLDRRSSNSSKNDKIGNIPKQFINPVRPCPRYSRLPIKKDMRTPVGENNKLVSLQNNHSKARQARVDRIKLDKSLSKQDQVKYVVDKVYEEESISGTRAQTVTEPEEMVKNHRSSIRSENDSVDDLMKENSSVSDCNMVSNLCYHSSMSSVHTGAGSPYRMTSEGDARSGKKHTFSNKDTITSEKEHQHDKQELNHGLKSLSQYHDVKNIERPKKISDMLNRFKTEMPSRNRKFDKRYSNERKPASNTAKHAKPLSLMDESDDDEERKPDIEREQNRSLSEYMESGEVTTPQTSYKKNRDQGFTVRKENRRSMDNEREEFDKLLESKEVHKSRKRGASDSLEEDFIDILSPFQHRSARKTVKIDQEVTQPPGPGRKANYVDVDEVCQTESSPLIKETRIMGRNLSDHEDEHEQNSKMQGICKLKRDKGGSFNSHFDHYDGETSKNKLHESVNDFKATPRSNRKLSLPFEKDKYHKNTGPDSMPTPICPKDGKVSRTYSTLESPEIIYRVPVKEEKLDYRKKLFRKSGRQASANVGRASHISDWCTNVDKESHKKQRMCKRTGLKEKVKLKRLSVKRKEKGKRNIDRNVHHLDEYRLSRPTMKEFRRRVSEPKSGQEERHFHSEFSFKDSPPTEKKTHSDTVKTGIAQRIEQRTMKLKKRAKRSLAFVPVEHEEIEYNNQTTGDELSEVDDTDDDNQVSSGNGIPSVYEEENIDAQDYFEGFESLDAEEYIDAKEYINDNESLDAQESIYAHEYKQFGYESSRARKDLTERNTDMVYQPLYQEDISEFRERTNNTRWNQYDNMRNSGMRKIRQKDKDKMASRRKSAPGKVIFQKKSGVAMDSTYLIDFESPLREERAYVKNM